MRRRDFIVSLGSSAMVWPLAARAQQPAIPVIGFLNGGTADGYRPMVEAFHRGLNETDYVEGQNVAMEYRWADGKYERLPAMAADLVHRNVSLIAANTPANLVAKAATGTIPIVFTTGTRPVQLGLVASLNRPGGNITGVTQLSEVVAQKRVELAHELVPTATVLTLLVNPTRPTAESVTAASRRAAEALGLQLDVLHATTEAEIDAAFMTFSQTRGGALVIGSDAFFNAHLELLAALALRHSVPAIYEYHPFAAAGGLVSYGGSITDSYRLAGVYVGRILKGEKPADLPVQESTKVELIINLKTAKALGLSVPLSIIGRADEVIE